MTGAVNALARCAAALAVMLLLHLPAPASLSTAAEAATATAENPAPILDLSADSIAKNPTQQSWFFLENNGRLSISAIRSTDVQKHFRPVTANQADFGYRKGGIWLRTKIRNTADQPLRRILHIQTNFMTEMDVYLENDSGLSQIMSQNINSVFSSRNIPYHNLATEIVLPPAQVSTLWIRYRSEGSTVLPLSIETANAFTKNISNTLSIDFAFYGVMAMFLLAAIAAAAFSAGPLFVAYFFYVLSVLLYIFQRDGYAFQYLWPNAPLWNNFSSLLLGTMLPVFAAIFARLYLQERGLGPRTKHVLTAIMLFQPLVVASAIFIDIAHVKQFAVLSTTLCILVFLIIGINAWRREGPQLAWFVTGWFGIVLASLTMAAFHNFGVELSRAQTLDTMRTAMVFDALMMGIASVASLIKLQRERLSLINEREAAFKRNMDLQNRLARLEQRHAIATALAQSSSKLVADTAHDLRQPLFALRAAMNDLMQTSRHEPDRVAQVEQSFRYIEDLVASTLDAATTDAEAAPEGPATTPEVVGASRILTAVAAMFEGESLASNVQLRVMPSSYDVEVNPLLVLRILGNFVSNAVQHAPGARVLLGARPRGRDLLFEVRDNGPGMTAPELESVLKRHVRGQSASATSGKGLGLSIVASLAENAGLAWSIRSAKGQGTIATLTVPIARKPAISHSQT